MRHMAVTEPACHKARDWLKAAAPMNMLLMAVTFPVCHEARGWLKAAAPMNMQHTAATELMF